MQSTRVAMTLIPYFKSVCITTYFRRSCYTKRVLVTHWRCACPGVGYVGDGVAAQAASSNFPAQALPAPMGSLPTLGRAQGSRHVAPYAAWPISGSTETSVFSREHVTANFLGKRLNSEMHIYTTILCIHSVGIMPGAGLPVCVQIHTCGV